MPTIKVIDQTGNKTAVARLDRSSQFEDVMEKADNALDMGLIENDQYQEYIEFLCKQHGIRYQ